MKFQDQQPLARRTMIAGAGTVGALAAAVSLLPGRQAGTPSPEAVAQAPSSSPSGYQVTEHVAKYYQTARV